MPIPKRGEKESKEEFMSRCMSNDKVKKEFPDQSQRVAVCMSNANLSAMEAADISYSYETFGFTEELTIYNLYIPSEAEYEDFNDEVEEIDLNTLICSIAGKPGLWENIRKKKEREGKNYKPAKRGDPDRPDPEAWKKAQSNDNEMAIHQLEKMHDQLMDMLMKLTTMLEIEFEDWTKDMISKAEIYIQNIYDFVTYYKAEDEVEEPSELETEDSYASEYQGRKVTLNKPFRTPKGPKKFSVYVKNDKGNVVKVNFGSPDMEIRRDDPARRKSFRARHQCDTNPGPKWKAKYWSCRQWRSDAPVED